LNDQRRCHICGRLTCCDWVFIPAVAKSQSRCISDLILSSQRDNKNTLKANPIQSSVGGIARITKVIGIGKVQTSRLAGIVLGADASVISIRAK
jgi:hypothetical protein